MFVAADDSVCQVGPEPETKPVLCIEPDDNQCKQFLEYPSSREPT